MSIALTGLDITAFSLNGGSMLALLKTAKPSFDNDLVDAGGIADDGEFMIISKAGHKFDYTVMQNNSNGIPCTNLDVSVWEIGTTNYLTRVRGGSINAGIKVAEGSSLAGGYKIPVCTRRTLEVSTDLLVFTTADLADIGFTGTAAQMALTVAITVGETVFSCPMTMKAGSVGFDREKTIMQNVTFSRRGAPTSPTDASLLGTILVGSGAIGFSLTTDGGNIFAASSAIMTRLNTAFADGAIVDMEGTLEVQGAITTS